MEDKLNVAKPKIGERYKNIKYKNERIDLTKKLLQLLKIDANNKVFTSYDLDKNKETQDKILEMIPDIEKYYVTTRWCYKKESKKEKKHLSITKSVLKVMDINFKPSCCKESIDGKTVNYSMYTIISDINLFLV